MNKEILLSNIDKIHTTSMGIDRIRNNLTLSHDSCDIVKYCTDKILNENCKIEKIGKNFYCEIENIRITINSRSYTIITAHRIKEKG